MGIKRLSVCICVLCTSATTLSGCEIGSAIDDAVDETVQDVEDAVDDVEQQLADAGIDDIDDLEDIKVDADFTMIHTRFDTTTGTFTELTPPPARRNLTDVFVINDTLYHVGGVNESGEYTVALEGYNAAANTWQRLADRPNPGLSYDMVLGDHLCGVGGFENLDTPIRKAVDCYDTATNAWTNRAPLPSDYAGFHPTAYQGKAYVFGGLNANLVPIDEAWEYDPVVDQWTALAPLPFGFSLGGVVPLNGKIYLVGGYKGAAVNKENIDDQAKGTDMLVYDIATNTWSTAPDMPHARFLYGAAPFENHVAVFFGLSDGPLVEFYNPEDGTWTAGTDPTDMPESGVYARPKGTDQLYLFTLATSVNTSEIGASGRLWRYSIANDAWDVAGKRSSAETDALFSGVQLGTSIHFVGAFTDVDLITSE